MSRLFVLFSSQDPALLPGTLLFNLDPHSHSPVHVVQQVAQALHIPTLTLAFLHLPLTPPFLLLLLPQSMPTALRQRIALARALLTDTKVIVVDSPSPALNIPEKNHLVHDLDPKWLAGRTVVCVDAPVGTSWGDRVICVSSVPC